MVAPAFQCVRMTGSAFDTSLIGYLILSTIHSAKSYERQLSCAEFEKVSDCNHLQSGR